jgi:hypothetical protein
MRRDCFCDQRQAFAAWLQQREIQQSDPIFLITQVVDFCKNQERSGVCRFGTRSNKMTSFNEELRMRERH